MFDLLTGEDLYADMVMRRTNDDRIFLVVEGAADVAVFDRFVDDSKCLLIPSHGKARALTAMQSVEAQSSPMIISILDRDWVGLLGTEFSLERVVYTDDYDLDACIFYSDKICEAVASSFSGPGKYRRGQPGCREYEIHDKCQDLAFPLGLIRYLSERRSIGLNLRNFPLGDVIDRGDMSVNMGKLVEVAIARSKGGAQMSADGLLEIFQAESSKIINKRRYCSGHDLAKALSIIIKSRWGGNVSADTIERAARSTMNVHLLKKFNFYRKVKRLARSMGIHVWAG